MNIVTGYRGEPHITANAMQAFNQGIFGSGNYVLDVGNKFAATLTNATTVTIQDGEGVMQGVHFRIEPGDTQSVTISPGTSGYKRIDYICARYEKSAITGIESVGLVVVEGTPDASSPSAPTINTGTILTGGTPVDFPLWKVSLDGLTPTLSSMIPDTRWYKLPASWGSTSVLFRSMFLFVNPALKLMSVAFYVYTMNGNTSNINFATKLPIMMPLTTETDSTPQTVRMIPMYKYGDGYYDNSKYAIIRNVNSSGNESTPDEWVGSQIDIKMSVDVARYYSGTIIIPYKELNADHPLSSGTPM